MTGTSEDTSIMVIILSPKTIKKINYFYIVLMI